MDFDRPTNSLTFEQAIAQEAERMKARRRKAAERRKARHAGYWDNETVEPKKPDCPRLCSEPKCGKSRKARGLCEAHYKAARRRSGRSS